MVMDSRKICPPGWHVPSLNEWTVLSNYLGGSEVAGGKLKETGTSHWLTPNTGATDIYGFTALPGGAKDCGNNYVSMGYNSRFWTSQPANQGVVPDVIINYDSSKIILGLNKGFTCNAFYVRCIKD